MFLFWWSARARALKKGYLNRLVLIGTSVTPAVVNEVYHLGIHPPTLTSCLVRETALLKHLREILHAAK